MNETANILQSLIDRNKRVEADKAWELSFTRRVFLAVLTYITASLLLWLLGQEGFLLLAFIPAISYVFSTLTLPWLKRIWMRSTRRSS